MAKDKRKMKAERAEKREEKDLNAQDANKAEEKADLVQVTVGGYKPLPKFKGCDNC